MKIIVNIFKILEWIFYIGLCIISLFFMSETWIKFNTKISSFAQSEEPITKHPTIVICFLPGKDFTYGKEFTIISHKQELKYGQNYGESFGNEIILIESINTSDFGTCYRITTEFKSKNEVKNWIWAEITLNFSNSLPKKDIPTSIKTYFTSYENSYGVVFAEWLDGDVLSFDIEVNTKVELVLSEEKVIRHKIKSNCMDRPFYKSLGAEIISNNFESCPSKCLPPIALEFTEPFNIPICDVKRGK